ncbi:hypothetical protein VQ042_00450 [Aurantimonas sp. A2-1-M11]|uniref:hypothetical protein n=1 Tax=Aurantimonas sp. A2-1-M11 TaxID=3113712 RepID=UPI002F92DC28
MTSDTSPPKTPQSDQAKADLDRSRDRIRQETESAKAEAGKATDNLRDAASDLSGKARQRAQEEGERGKETVASGLDDFAAAVRKASDELGTRDQSMASSLVREVAGGLEQASKTIHGKDVGELTRSVARFARERPATFLAGAALAGLALGRFARSSSEHETDDYAPRSNDGPSRPTGGPVPAGYRASYSDQPRPTEGAFPRDGDPVTGTTRGPVNPARPAPSPVSPASTTTTLPGDRK